MVKRVESLPRRRSTGARPKYQGAQPKYGKNRDKRSRPVRVVVGYGEDSGDAARGLVDLPSRPGVFCVIFSSRRVAEGLG